MQTIGRMPMTAMAMRMVLVGRSEILTPEVLLLARKEMLSLIHISEPTRQAEISYAVFCLKKKKKQD